MDPYSSQTTYGYSQTGLVQTQNSQQAFPDDQDSQITGVAVEPIHQAGAAMFQGGELAAQAIADLMVHELPLPNPLAFLPQNNNEPHPVPEDVHPVDVNIPLPNPQAIVPGNNDDRPETPVAGNQGIDRRPPDIYEARRLARERALAHRPQPNLAQINAIQAAFRANMALMVAYYQVAGGGSNGSTRV